MEVATTSSQLTVVLDQSGLPLRKAEIIRQQFSDYFDIAEQYKKEAQALVVTGEDQTELMGSARQARLFLRGKRILIEKTRKALKEESLAEGRAIDNVAKLLTSLIEPTEDFLQLQEDFAKRAEEARKAELRRQEQLREKQIDERMALVKVYSLDQPLPERSMIADLSDDDWFHHLNRLKLWHQNELEERRKKDQRDRDELLKENQRLADEQRKRDEENRLAQEALQQQLHEQQEQNKRQQQQLQQQRQQQQLQAQQRQILATGSDRQKLCGLADAIGAIELPDVSTTGGREIVDGVKTLFSKVQGFIREKSDLL